MFSVLACGVAAECGKIVLNTKGWLKFVAFGYKMGDISQHYGMLNWKKDSPESQLDMREACGENLQRTGLVLSVIIGTISCYFPVAERRVVAQGLYMCYYCLDWVPEAALKAKNMCFCNIWGWCVWKMPWRRYLGCLYKVYRWWCSGSQPKARQWQFEARRFKCERIV